MLKLFFDVVPITCLVGLVYAIGRAVYLSRQGRPIARGTEVMRFLFICYLTGLVNLILVPGNLWSSVWFYLRNGYPSGADLYLFSGSFNFVPSLLKYLRGDLVLGSWVKQMLVGNLLMFLPMGFFLPFVSVRVNNKNIFVFAAAVPAAFELIQPVMGRSFDIDDLICNFVGILLGYALAAALRAAAAASSR